MKIELSKILYTMAVVLTCTFIPTLQAETCDEVEVIIPESLTAQRADIVHHISVTLHRSILAEIRYPSADTSPLLLDAGTHSMTDVARLLNGPGLGYCDIVGGVIHLFDPTLLRGPENALNHLFRGFVVPSNAKIFILQFKARLYHEAFDSTQADYPAGPGGGALSSEEMKTLLKPEILQNIDARDLFLNEARQAILCLVIEIPLKARNARPGNWIEIDKQFHLNVVS